MGESSKIQWTDHTFNPWWGCHRVSPGCEHCYAEAFAKRTGNAVWGPSSPRRLFGDEHWNEPLKWNEAAERDGVRRRVFCASMADVFEDRRDLDEPRARAFALIERTPALDWQLLTKRPENMIKLAPSAWEKTWPSNVWAGCTVESQEYANMRIPWLLEVPASILFLSCEPLLSPVDLESIKPHDLKREKRPHDPIVSINSLTGLVSGMHEHIGRPIAWVIGGGESGGGARSMAFEWADDIAAACERAGVAFFMKQGGTKPTWDGKPIRLRSRKGDDPSEWPVPWSRSFPRAAP